MPYTLGASDVVFLSPATERGPVQILQVCWERRRLSHVQLSCMVGTLREAEDIYNSRLGGDALEICYQPKVLFHYTQ